MEKTELFDESRYLDKGSKFIATFLYKVNCLLSVIGLEAEMGNHLPVHVVIKDGKTKKPLMEWHVDEYCYSHGITNPGALFQDIKFQTLDKKEYNLITANSGRYELHSREGDIKKEIAVIFDNNEVSGIEITTRDVNDDFDNMIERVNILQRPKISKIYIQYCKDGCERSLYYKYDSKIEMHLVEGRIDFSDAGDRDVRGLVIKILDGENSIMYDNDERYDNILPLETKRAASYIKQGFSLPRNQELFTHMRDSLNVQYPGAMPLIMSKLGEVYKLCSLNEPLDPEFVKLHEEYTSQMVEFDSPINMNEPYIIEEEREDIIRQ